MKDQDAETTAGVVIKRLDEQHSKYRFMEMNLVGKKRRLKKQMPDIRSSLDVLKLMQSRSASGQPLTTNFLLSDEIYMQAEIPATEQISLWLGANVMLTYPLDEAEQLLRRNLQTAEKNLAQIDVDLDYLRDQITTTEVNMARVYNWDVKRRASEKQTAESV
jgi:prefoldin subunit 5